MKVSKNILKSRGVRIIYGLGRFLDRNTIEILNGDEKKRISSKYFVIATGSHSRCIQNHQFDEQTIISSGCALNFAEVPKIDDHY